VSHAGDEAEFVLSFSLLWEYLNK